MSDRPRQLGLAVLIVFHALFAFLLPKVWADGDSEPMMALLLGLGVGQVALLSGWTAIGPGRFVDRVPAVLFLIALFWYLLLLGNRLLAWPLSKSESVFLGILVFGEYAFLQVPFWSVRGMLGWRIEQDDGGRNRERMGDTQFGMGRLLAWTAGAATLLAAGRWLVPMTNEHLLHPELSEPETYIVCFAISIFNVTLSLPAVWIAFRAGWAWPLWVTVLGIGCAFLSAMEVAILTVIEGSAPPDAYGVVMALNVGLFACLAGTFAATRPLGYRMSRAAWPRRDTPEGIVPS